MLLSTTAAMAGGEGGTAREADSLGDEDVETPDNVARRGQDRAAVELQDGLTPLPALVQPHFLQHRRERVAAQAR